MDASTTEKFQYISAWLKGLFGSTRQIPEFEINKQTIDALYDLALLNKKRDFELSVQIEDSTEKWDASASEANRLYEVLTGIGLHISMNGKAQASSSVSPVTHKSTDLLCRLAQEFSLLAQCLDVVSTESIIMLCGLSDLKARARAAHSQRQQLAKLQSNMRMELKDAVALRSDLKQAVAHLDATFESQKPTMQERIANLKYLESKSKEYAVSIQNLKDTFKQTSVTPSIYHSSLMQLYAHLSELDQQLQPKLKDLTGYMQLPPDVAMAKLRIEEAKSTLQELEEELSRSVRGLQLHSIH